MTAIDTQSPRNRLKVVLYNPRAVFFTMPLALLAIGSELDPDLYEVVIVDARLDPDAENTVLSHIDEALCLGVTVLTGAPISDALNIPVGEGSTLVIEAVARGFRLPETLEDWATFDYVAGEPGPWVSGEKFQLIERFKFFHDLAWKRVSRGKRLLQQLARYRCDRDYYRWPIEMLFTRWLVPVQTLS